MDAQDDLCSEQSLDLGSDLGSDLERTITLVEAQALLSDSGKRIDDTFYFQDAFFEVEDTIFKVHRHDFEDSSPVFRDMFDVGMADATEGLLPDNPIRLDGVSVEDFRQLLRAIYRTPLKSAARKPKSTSDGETFTTSNCIAVLKLATMWQMDHYRKFAINFISTQASGLLSPAQRLSLSMTYRVKQWFVPALIELAQRQKPMGAEECDILGAECLWKICEVRERFQHCSSCRCAPVYENDPETGTSRNRYVYCGIRRQEYDFTEDIEEVFYKDIASFE